MFPLPTPPSASSRRVPGRWDDAYILALEQWVVWHTVASTLPSHVPHLTQLTHMHPLPLLPWCLSFAIVPCHLTHPCGFWPCCPVLPPTNRANSLHYFVVSVPVRCAARRSTARRAIATSSSVLLLLRRSGCLAGSCLLPSLFCRSLHAEILFSTRASGRRRRRLAAPMGRKGGLLQQRATPSSTLPVRHPLRPSHSASPTCTLPTVVPVNTWCLICTTPPAHHYTVTLYAWDPQPSSAPMPHQHPWMEQILFHNHPF